MSNGLLRSSQFLFMGLISAMAGAAQTQTAAVLSGGRIDLRNGWSIQSSAKIPQKGPELSTAGFQPGGWYAATVPATVVGAMVANKIVSGSVFLREPAADPWQRRPGADKMSAAPRRPTARLPSPGGTARRFRFQQQ